MLGLTGLLTAMPSQPSGNMSTIVLGATVFLAALLFVCAWVIRAMRRTPGNSLAYQPPNVRCARCGEHLFGRSTCSHCGATSERMTDGSDDMHKACIRGSDGS